MATTQEIPKFSTVRHWTFNIINNIIMKKAAVGSTRLKITLFRSLLRWTRQPAVVQSKFSLDPSEFGVEDLLPKSVRRIRNHTGVYGAISYLFRQQGDVKNALREARGKTALSDSDAVDAALDVLKRLNQLGSQLKERLNQRIKNSSLDVHSKAVYSIGTTLHHLPTGSRCVVVGWDVDMATGQQRYVTQPDSHTVVLPSVILP